MAEPWSNTPVVEIPAVACPRCGFRYWIKVRTIATESGDIERLQICAHKKVSGGCGLRYRIRLCPPVSGLSPINPFDTDTMTT